MDNIKVLVADDHSILRRGLRSVLNGEAGIEVVGEAEDGREAVEKAQESQPDVVLMDITMPELNGLEATRQIKRLCPQVDVLILTMHANEEYILQALRVGASGYLLKQSAATELISAIRALSEGGHFLSPFISKETMAEYIRQAEPTIARDNYRELTDCERQVLQLLAEGHPNRRIAQLLHINTKTVEAYRAHLMGKLGVNSTAELTEHAIRRGLISPDQ